MQIKSKNYRGYTIIEVLIVLVTMAILFTIGFGNYRDYQRRQYLEGAIRQIKSDLRLAQEYALSGRKPQEPPGNACFTNALEGYIFRLETNTTYSVYARCANSDIQIKGPDPLPPGVEINPFPLIGGNDILFQILGKGANRSATIVLTWPAGGVPNKQVDVTKGGEIK